MNKTKKGGIKKYCKKKGISMKELSKITGVTYSQLYLLDKDPFYPARLQTILKIYKGSRKKLGEALKPGDFLDFPFLHSR